MTPPPRDTLHDDVVVGQQAAELGWCGRHIADAIVKDYSQLVTFEAAFQIPLAIAIGLAFTDQFVEFLTLPLYEEF